MNRKVRENFVLVTVFIEVVAVFCANISQAVTSDKNQTDLEELIIRIRKSQAKELCLEQGNVPEISNGSFSGLRLTEVKLNHVNLLLLEEGAFAHLEYSLEYLDLSKNLLPDVPTSAIKNLRRLWFLFLSWNNITEIGSGAFVGLKSLTTLDLSHNQILKIDSQAFVCLDRLTSLDLSHNNLHVVPGEALQLKLLSHLSLEGNQIKSLAEKDFQGCQNLKYLHLTGNLIKRVGPSVFQNLNRLTKLYLNDNDIIQLDENAFTSIGETLSHLHLENNSLSEFPSVALSPIKKLRYLNVAENNISALSPDSFQGFGNLLWKIELQGNRISSLPRGLFENMNVWWLDLKENRLQEMDWSLLLPVFKTLNYIWLEGNKLKCHCNLQLYSQWLELSDMIADVSLDLPECKECSTQAEKSHLTHCHENYVHFKNTPSELTTSSNLSSHLKRAVLATRVKPDKTDLIIHNHSVPLLPNNTFSGLRLGTIVINNAGLRLIEESAFNCMGYRLTRLDLRFNLLPQIPSASLKGLSQLEVLKLADNHISSVEAHAFNDLISLRILDLSNNRISEIDFLAFSGLHRLERLYLRNNLLKVVPSGISQVTFLHLGDNKITDVTKESFAKYSKLADLYLDGNTISSLASTSFHNIADTLEDLSLRNNRLERVPTEALKEVRNLLRLNLEGNKIKAIQNGDFHFLAKTLEHIDLSKNGLENIAMGSLGTLMLRELNLDTNKLHQVNCELFASFLGDSVDINLEGNPLECTCGLLWYKNLLLLKLGQEIIPNMPKCLAAQGDKPKLFNITDAPISKKECSSYITNASDVRNYCHITNLLL